MKDFIKRVSNALIYEDSFVIEPLFFKVFVFFVGVFVGLFAIFFCVAAFITVPLWIVPYTIYWCHKNKKKKGGAVKNDITGSHRNHKNCNCRD